MRVSVIVVRILRCLVANGVLFAASPSLSATPSPSTQSGGDSCSDQNQAACLNEKQTCVDEGGPTCYCLGMYDSCLGTSESYSFCSESFLCRDSAIFHILLVLLCELSSRCRQLPVPARRFADRELHERGLYLLSVRAAAAVAVGVWVRQRECVSVDVAVCVGCATLSRTSRLLRRAAAV